MVLQFQTHFQFSCVVQLWFNRMKVTVTKRGPQGSSCYFSFGSKCLLSPRNRPIGLLHPIHCMIPFIKIDFPNTALVGLKLHPVISLASRDCRRLFSFSKAPFPWPRATWPPWFPVGRDSTKINGGKGGKGFGYLIHQPKRQSFLNGGKGVIHT